MYYYTFTRGTNVDAGDVRSAINEEFPGLVENCQVAGNYNPVPIMLICTTELSAEQKLAVQGIIDSLPEFISP